MRQRHRQLRRAAVSEELGGRREVEGEGKNGDAPAALARAQAAAAVAAGCGGVVVVGELPWG